MSKNDKSMNFYLIIAVSLASFITAYTSNVSVIALPQIANYFNLSIILQNWVVNIFLLTIAVLSIPFGKLCSKWGLKKSFLISEAMFAVGAIGTILSINAAILFFFRVFQATASSAIFVTAVAMLVKAIPEEHRGKALGINIGAVYIGLSLSPFLGGSLTYNLGWQSIFLITIPIVLLIIAIILVKVPNEWKEGENDPIDYKGSIFYTIGIICFMYGFTILNELNGLFITIMGIIFLLCFALYELKVEYPIFDVKLFKNHKFLSSNIASLISYVAIYGVTTILNYHFQYICGYTSQMTGIILVATPLTQSIITPQSGKLSDKVNPQKLAAFGMGLVTLALFILTFLNKNTPLWIVIIAMLLQGAGFGIFSSPNTNTIMSSVPIESTGMASASVSTMRVIGQTMAMGLLTVIFAFVIGDVVISPKVYSGLGLSCHYALVIACILAGISVLISLVGMKSNDKLKY